MFQAQNRETINRTLKVAVSFKIIMTTSVTRPCFTTPQHQTCKTKTDFFGPRPDVLRAMVSDHITRLHKGKRHYISLLLASLHQFCGFWLGCWYPRLYRLQWCGLRPSVVGQDRSQTKNIGLVLDAVVFVLQVWCCVVMMKLAVTTGTIRRAKLQSNCHHQQTNTQFFTGRLPFLSPNQQFHNTSPDL